MGGTSYSTINRTIRAKVQNYARISIGNIFTQQKVKKVHEKMDSKGIDIRESRDSEIHPEAFPIIIALDLTGSMGYIPHHLVKEGLPTLMSGIIQAGLKSPSLLFLGIGDHECDEYPLQIGQFESGDKELDMWLTRTYLESGGGGNAGESYSLAHYFAAKHIQTDAWDKRKQKGILITIGDEPNLKSYPSSAMNEVMGNNNIATFNDSEILEETLKRWDVYHIYPIKYFEREETISYWKQLLKERFFMVDTVKEIVETIKEIVIKQTLGKTVKSNKTDKDNSQEQD